MKYQIKIIKNSLLKPHERTRETHAKGLLKQIVADGMLKNPIVVDKKSGVILDGHHRFWVMENLGLTRIAAYLVNYQDKKIKVVPWRKGEKITKEQVIQAGIMEKLLRPKTSKHLISNRPKRINILLNKLI